MKIIFTSCIIFAYFSLCSLAQKNIVFLVGERFNSTSQTMPSLAVSLEDEFKHKTYYINIPKNGAAENLKLIENADLLICYFQLRNLPKEQISLISRHIEAGKSVIAFNSTSQAFEKEPKWFAKYFGGGFRGKVKGSNKTRITVSPEKEKHPIVEDLRSFTFSVSHPAAIPGPLHQNASPILMGKSGIAPAFPVAWTFKYKANSRIFYTSLGTAKDFSNDVFKQVVNNAVKWCLSKKETERWKEASYPDPPVLNAPNKAILLFSGRDLIQWQHWDLLQHPYSIELDEQTQKFANISNRNRPSWETKKGQLIAIPGKGDLITKGSYGNYMLNVDFLIPEEPEYVSEDIGGSGGIFISGRYEIKINKGSQRSRIGPNSIYSMRPPDFEMDMKAGVWHNMKIKYKHLNKAPAVISVTVNGKQLHGSIKLKKSTPFGIIDPLSPENPEDKSLHTVDKAFTDEKMKMADNEFTVATRFKTTASTGTVFARTSEATGWERDGKAFFIGGGKIYYDIGWRAIIRTERTVNDGKWHHAVLTNTADMCIMYVDGEVAFMKKKFNQPDPAGHVFKIGYEFKNFYKPFDGEISNVRYFNRALNYEEVMELNEKNSSSVEAVFDWKPDPDKKPIVKELDKNTVLKGPIRLHGDFSRIRYANIWLKELKE